MKISATSYAEAAELVESWISEKKSRYICICSVNNIMSGRRNPEHRAIVNSADLATSDGMPLVWFLRLSGMRKQKRVYGPNLMLEICRSSAKKGHRIFLYGAIDATLEALERNLKNKFPGLLIAGKYAPPFRPLTSEEDKSATELIRQSEADIVFVGLSTPKQEKWMFEHRKTLNCVMVGVGAAFDFHAGKVRQAPAFFQKLSLEWFYRFCMEPRRLFKRYLTQNPVFLMLSIFHLLGISIPPRK